VQPMSACFPGSLAQVLHGNAGRAVIIANRTKRVGDVPSAANWAAPPQALHEGNSGDFGAQETQAKHLPFNNFRQNKLT
jgi:hypothetical protein